MRQIVDVFSLRLPYSVIGNGAVERVSGVARQLGGTKALIVTDPGVVKSGLVDKVKQPLEKEGIGVEIFGDIRVNVPLNDVKKGAQVAKDSGCDLIIGLGGGSPMDAAKVISVVATAKDIAQEDMHDYLHEVEGRCGLPVVAIPTTSGTGAEWSVIAMIVDESDGEKKAAVYPDLLPDAVILDPLLTLNLPQKITADTGVDALAHAIEGYTGSGNRFNVLTDMFLETAIKLVANNLRAAYGKGNKDEEARYNMSVASMIALMPADFSGGNTLAHGLGQALQLKAPDCTHGLSCSLVLPYVMEYNMINTMPRLARIAELMGEKIEGLSLRDAAQKAVEAVRKLSSDIGMPQRLRDIGLKKEDFPQIVNTLFAQYASWAVDMNPRTASREDVARILEAAW